MWSLIANQRCPELAVSCRPATAVIAGVVAALCLGATCAAAQDLASLAAAVTSLQQQLSSVQVDLANAKAQLAATQPTSAA